MGAKKGPQGWTQRTPCAERDVASQGSGTGRQTDRRTNRRAGLLERQQLMEGWAAGRLRGAPRCDPH